EMASALGEAIAAGRLPACCRAVPGKLVDLAADSQFDAVAYIDVLEHIERDADELALAARHLRPGGVLIVVAPAHPWLFSPFDAAIGHHRRYTRHALRQVGPRELELERLDYLDSVGLLASATNRLLLQTSQPTSHQIFVWDAFMVPVSRCLDVLLGF